jgi:plasmid stabilization system protein ParE
MATFIILPEAKLDIKKASEWYDEQQSKLGKSFRDEVKITATYIQHYPESFEVKYNQFRGCRVNRFPYFVFYRMHLEKIVIVAVIATKQEREGILEKR